MQLKTSSAAEALRLRDRRALALLHRDLLLLERFLRGLSLVEPKRGLCATYPTAAL